jgi:hypothetical protein
MYLRSSGFNPADIGGHRGYRNRLAARLRFDLLEIEQGGQRMAAHADQRAAAGRGPLRGMRGVRTGVAFFALHEQHFILRGFQDFDRLGHRRRIDPILGVHEQFAARLHRGGGLVHLLHHALVHRRLRHVLADRRFIAVLPEIAGKRLLADHVLPGLHRLDDHRGMQIGWRADVDDVEVLVGDQFLEAAIGLADAVLLREFSNVIAARRHRGHLRIDAIDALVRIHVQLGDEAAAG